MSKSRRPNPRRGYNKCARKFDHLWETERETKTHIVKVCTRCNGHLWKLRRDE